MGNLFTTKLNAATIVLIPACIGIIIWESFLLHS